MPIIGSAAVAPVARERVHTLPNGSTGQPYQFLLSGLKSAQLPPELGLQCSANGQLQGTPELAGEYRFSAEDAQGPLWLEIFIAPNPRSLWQNHPSKRCAPGWKPDSFADSLVTASHHLLVASRRGRSHAHKGGFREDEGRVFEAAGWQGLVVADGAGSAPLSRFGSTLAVAAAAETLGSQLFAEASPQAALTAAAQAALAALEAEASRQQVPVKQFYTTLLMALVRDGEAHTLHIGDGLMAAAANGEWRLLSAPEQGEFSNQTQFVDAESVAGVEARIQSHVLPAGATVWVMSDGVSDAWLEDPASPEEFAVQFAGAATPEQLLAALDFWRPGCHDDATLAVARPL